jgi:hypothetical protein
VKRGSKTFEEKLIGKVKVNKRDKDRAKKDLEKIIGVVKVTTKTKNK